MKLVTKSYFRIQLKLAITLIFKSFSFLDFEYFIKVGLRT